MHKPIKYAEKALTYAAGAAWIVFDKLNQIGQNPGFTPKWSRQAAAEVAGKRPSRRWAGRARPIRCARAACRKSASRSWTARRPLEVLYTDKPGEIKAQVIERDGKILMVKDCPIHGHFEDVMAIDTAFFKHLEDVFPGRDIRAHNDAKLHKHGSSTITHGRGSVLTVDLTNRCNMMCDPVLHGRQPGGLRARAELGRHQDAARQRHHHQAEAPDVGAVLGRRADHFAVLPGRRALRARGGLHLACRRPPTASSSPRARNSAARRPMPACATPTCSSTASATPPTRTARSATCST